MKKTKIISLLLVSVILFCTLALPFSVSAETVMLNFKPVTKNAKIYGIPAATSLTDVKYSLYGYDVVALDLNKKTVTSPKTQVGTGFTIKINSVKYTAVIMGDLDGDGEITVFDYSLIKAAYLDQATLSSVQKEAAQVEGDFISALSYVKIKRAYFGTYNMNAAYECEPYDPLDGEHGWSPGWV